MKIKTECGSCGGTGLYVGMAEPKGTAVVCLRCDGTGCREIEAIEFSGRKRREGISIVRRSRGSLIVRWGPTGGSVTYEQFLAGEFPDN
jgi:hypothetical protein